MPMCLKRMILVVLVCVWAVSDAQINFNFSDRDPGYTIPRVLGQGNGIVFNQPVPGPGPGFGHPRPPITPDKYSSSHPSVDDVAGGGVGFVHLQPPFTPDKYSSSHPSVDDDRQGQPEPPNTKDDLNHDSFLPDIIYPDRSEHNDSVPSDRRCNQEQDVDSIPYPGTRRGVTSWKEISEEAELYLKGRLSTILIPSLYTLVCLISVPFNICALLVFILRIKPKPPAVIYMLNLACADLLFAMVLPFKISYHFNGNDWIFGPTMCRLVTAAFYWNMYSSVLLIACISVDRLIAVVYPMDSLTWRSPGKAIIACAAMWVLSFIGSMHLLFTEQTVPLKQLNITTCNDVQPSKLFSCYKMYFVTLCFLLFFLPLIITAVSYTRVILTLSKAQPRVPDHALKKRRAVVLVSIVLVMFVLCFTPTNLVFIVHQLKFNEEDVVNYADRLYIVYQVFQCLGSLNCLLDPLVYYFGSSQFQKELSSVLGRQKTAQGSSSGQPSTDPSTSTSQTLLKSNRKEGSKTNSSLTNSDSQGNLCSQCKKVLV